MRKLDIDAKVKICIAKDSITNSLEHKIEVEVLIGGFYDELRNRVSRVQLQIRED